MATAQYQWKANNACVATYKVLEGDNFLDQFEDKDIPFEKAGSVKMGTLRYFPKTTGNIDIIDVISMGIARDFLKGVVKTYVVTKEKQTINSADILTAIAEIFGDGKKTICDLAEVVDGLIKFPDEM
ncbi:hypothetical protein ACO0K9_02200 [Undibacterium sp. Ji50W]|uniref:hypothetical protein n=1 Tax=Undibacterium sp. Ji50W TaxID=3413041 RepID=UPI003BEF5994